MPLRDEAVFIIASGMPFHNLRAFRDPRAAHPREEHLLPLMVASGAAGEDRAVVAFNDTFAGIRLSAYHFPG